MRSSSRPRRVLCVPAPRFATSRAAGRYGQFVDAVRECETQTPLITSDDLPAHVLWASHHGHVILELTRQAPNADRAQPTTGRSTRRWQACALAGCASAGRAAASVR